MEKINKNKIYYSEENNGSFWRVKTLTERTIELERIKDVNNNADDIGVDFDEITCKWDNRCKHHISMDDDESFTIYPYRNGQPFCFQPATIEDCNMEIKSCKKWGVSEKFYQDIKTEIKESSLNNIKIPFLIGV
ncbi:hypothetical protein KKC91_10950 [bacterium]|nr:hypothetical protein [bacterium]